MTEIREFGTGLRDHLQRHGVNLEFRADRPSNADLFELCAVTTQRPVLGVLTFQPAIAA